QACVVPPLLQIMMGLSEVARHPAPPQPQAASVPPSQPGSWAWRGPIPTWSQPLSLSQQRLGRQCCLGLWAGLIPHQQPLPGHPPQASSFPTAAGLWPPASALRGTLGHRAIYLALWPPFLGPHRLHFRKSRTLYPNCLLPAPPPCTEVGLQQPAGGPFPSCPSPWGILGYSSGSTTLPRPCSEGLISLEAPSRMAGSVLSLASLVLFMLVFTIRSGVSGQAAPPGVGRVVLCEPLWLDSTVPRPTEDTVM
uniref:Uncharacterized protein n=1 Tax=Cricetulus griseus TaxID=10029 RepID=A0A8C2M9G5_CRIGR